MLEASRGPYKIAWIIEHMDDNIEKCTLRSFDPIGVLLWRVYQSLHWLHRNGMKLSELVALVPVSIAVGSKKLKTLWSGPNGEDKVGPPSQIGPYLAPLLQMREVWKFYHRCHSLRWSFFVADVFCPVFCFLGKNLQKMLIFYVFSAEISLWSPNRILTFISALESTNCPLSNAETPRSVACSWAKWQSHLWGLLSNLPQLCTPLR
jgi:hypothetical protein